MECMPPKRPKAAARPKRSAGRTVRTKRPVLKMEIEEPRQPIIHPDEKRELILAHAAMRRPHDPVQLMSLWAGVAATFIVVVTAWWWASKPGYLNAFSQPFDRGFEKAKEEAATFGHEVRSISAERVGGIMTDLSSAAARLDALSAQVDQDQKALDRMASLVSSTAPSEGLFKVKPTSTTSNN